MGEDRDRHHDPARVAPPPEAVERLEVVVPEGLAGAVRAAPVLRALRDAYPEAVLAVRGSVHGEELLHLAAWVDTPEGDPVHGPSTFLVDLRPPTPLHGAELGRMAGGCGWVAAFRNPREARSHLIHAGWEVAASASDNMMRLAWLAGASDRHHTPTVLSAPGAARNRAARLLRGHHGPIVVIHPFAGKPARRWSDATTIPVTRLAVELGVGAVLVGDHADTGPAARLVEHLTVPVTDLAGMTDVATLLAVLERADMFAGTWSGPAALASAIGTPAIIAGPVPTVERDAGHPRTRYVLPSSRQPAAGTQHESAAIPLEQLLSEVSIVARRVSTGWRRAGGSSS